MKPWIVGALDAALFLVAVMRCGFTASMCGCCGRWPLVVKEVVTLDGVIVHAICFDVFFVFDKRRMPANNGRSGRSA